MVLTTTLELTPTFPLFPPPDAILCCAELWTPSTPFSKPHISLQEVGENFWLIFLRLNTDLIVLFLQKYFQFHALWTQIKKKKNPQF